MNALLLLWLLCCPDFHVRPPDGYPPVPLVIRKVERPRILEPDRARDLRPISKKLGGQSC